MRHTCPSCQRGFDEPGFCPFDGKPLVAAVEAMSAADDKSGRAQAALRERGSEYDRLVGQTLDGRYYVQKKLGEGGMGVVFAARHAVIERPLAIKVLKREATRDAATIQRFVREAQAASRIGHPNIVDVTDFGTTPDGMTYSVMELVDGVTLAKAIKESAPFTAERSARIAAQIARALAAAHDKRIVHRDLKPENVFLIEREGRPDFVKIVDFGIAKVQPVDDASATAGGPRLTRVGSVFGTPEYMAPEQASGRGETDHRVDIYALGTILYQMLVGKVPHKGRNMMATITMQMLEVVTPPSQANPSAHIPPALEQIVMKALAKNRDDRHATMADLYAELEALLPTLQHPEPALSLPPLPPGADPALAPGRRAGSESEPAIELPRRKKPLTKPLHEPEFVAGPLSLHHAFEEAEPIARRRRWPWLVLALVVVAGGVAGGLWLMQRPNGAVPSADALAASAVARDAAAIVAEAPPDAPPADPPPVPPDAAPVALHAPRDAGTTTTLTRPGAHPATIVVEVLTRPAEADIFVGHAFRGPSGTRLEERYGAKLQIECRAPHMKGKKTVVFDGSVSSVLCTATRLPMCVADELGGTLKNPYDDCEEPASAGSSQGPITHPH